MYMRNNLLFVAYRMVPTFVRMYMSRKSVLELTKLTTTIPFVPSFLNFLLLMGFNFLL